MPPHVEVAENTSPLLLWEILMQTGKEEGDFLSENPTVSKSCYVDESHKNREHEGQLGSDGEHHDIQMLRPVGTLGRGNMGTVVLVVNKQSRSNNDTTDEYECMRPFAMKVMKKHARKKQRSRRAHTEREILSSLQHPFLQSLHAHFESDKHSLLLLDFCPGGDLNVLRHKQPDKRFTETATRFYAAEVLDALDHLHKLGIVYRDLKPENILIQESGHVMLTDFDLSLRLDEPEGMAPQSQLGLNITDHEDTNCASNGDNWDKDVDEEAGGGISSYAACLGSCISGVRRGTASSGEFRSTMCCVGAARSSNCGAGERLLQKQMNGEIRDDAIPAAAAAASASANSHNSCKQEKFKAKAVPRITAGSDRSSMNKYRNAKIAGGPAPGEEAGGGREWFFVGTEEYVAPEILSGQEHGYGVDWWAYGILLYELIYGATPFKGRTRRETFANIMGREPAFPGTPTPLKDLIQRLLVKDPARRLAGGPAIRAHPFFAGVQWASLPHVCRPPVIPAPFSLPAFEAAAKRRAAAAAAHAAAAAAARLAARSCHVATSASSSHYGAATSSDFFPGRRDSSASSSRSSCQIGGSSPSCSSRGSDSPARDDQLTLEDIFSQFSMMQQSKQPWTSSLNSP